MMLRFVHAVSAPAWTIQAGREITVETLTPQLRTWLERGIVEVVRDDGAVESAVLEPERERAVLPQRRRRRSETVV